MAGPGSPHQVLSLVQDYGVHDSSCGYCGSASGSVSHGMAADLLTVECYQELLDRGWRRSGRWLYRPLHDRACCQLVTIRLDVHRFAPSRDQRRVQRRWDAYLAGGPMPGQHRAVQQEQGSAMHADGQRRQQQQQERQQEPGMRDWQDIPQVQQQQAMPGWQQQLRNRLQGTTAAPAAVSAPSSALEFGSPGREVQGGSPKRAYDEIDVSWLPAGTGEEQQDQQPSAGGEQETGGGKRARAGGGRNAAFASEPQQQAELMCLHPMEREPSLASAFKTVQLHVQQQQQQQQGQQQQQASSSTPAGASAAAAGLPDAPSLAAALQAALEACLTAGELPAAAYPAPKVQPPSAKQKKALPLGVEYSSAFPLAVAAAAVRASKAGGTPASRSQGTATPQATAELLVSRLELPAHTSAAATNGFINFSLPSQVGSAAAPAAAQGSTGQEVGSGKPQLQREQQQQQQRQQQNSTGSAAARGSTTSNSLVPAAAAAAAGLVNGAGDRSGSQACGSIPRGVPRNFELRMVPSSDPSLPEVEFSLYQRYQVLHHGDEPHEVTPSSFKRFLCDSPLRRAGPEDYPPGTCPPSGFGSFHQQYWLDGVLVAVGVVDILPRCLSSKYLFWEPGMAPLSLGKLTSLQEIGWVSQASAACPSLHYYYLGFYLHSCHRMKYKGDFQPSDLLCPLTQCWVPLERTLATWEAEPHGCHSLAEIPGALQGLGQEHRVEGGRPACPPRRPTEQELDGIRLLISSGGGRRRGQLVTVGQLRTLWALVPGMEARVLSQLGDWAEQVGPEAWAQMALKV